MSNSKSFLDEIALIPPFTGRLYARRFDDYPINTESLMELLRRQVRVNYGLRLEHEGTFAWKASLLHGITLVKKSGLLRVACLLVQMACFHQVGPINLHIVPH